MPLSNYRIRQFMEVIVLAGFICIIALPVCGQKKKQPFNVNVLFGDLPIDDPAANTVLKPNEDPAAKISANIIVKASLNSIRCFTGEPVLLLVQLYTRLNSDSKVLQRPALDGFTVSAKEFNNDNVVYKTVGGLKYRVFTIGKLQLIPFADGRLYIEPFIVNSTASYETPDHKKHVYSGTSHSSGLVLNVDKLPPANKPNGFTGLVGSFRLQAGLDDSVSNAGQTRVLRITVSGSGNIAAIEPPVVAWPPSVDVYPPHEKTLINDSLFPTEGQKTFEFNFVCKRPGKLTIPPVWMSFFNPVTRSYERVSSQPMSLLVVEPVTLQPDPGSARSKASPARGIGILWTGLLAAGLVLLVAIFVVSKRNEKKKRAGVTLIASEPAEPVKSAIDFTGELEILAAAKDISVFPVGCKNLLLQFIAARLKMPEASPEKLLAILKEKDSAFFDSVDKIYQDCHFFIYAPAAFTVNNLEQMVARCKELFQEG